MKKRIPAAAAVILVVCVAAGCGGSGGSETSTSSSSSSSSSPSTLIGAGSTLVAPLLAKWQSDYAAADNVTVTYGPVGSGSGILNITNRTVDFGASDAPLTSVQQKACHGCVQLPWALAATLPVYNIPGVGKGLRLTGPVLADIYLGKITTWNDKAIAKLNPKLHLPSEKISVVYRSDGSGDTFVWTSYLASVSPQWRSTVGKPTTTLTNWPTGTGEPKNSGVAATVQQTSGAIGYVAIAQAISSGLDYAAVENKAGNFATPSNKAISAAAATAHFGKDNSATIVNPPASAKNAYPLSTFTYVIVPRSSSKLAALQKFITYAVTTGQRDAKVYDFAPLPAPVVAKDKAIVKGL